MMDRRTFVAGSATTLAAGIAGCSALPGFGDEDLEYYDWVSESVAEADGQAVMVWSTDVSAFRSLDSIPEDRLEDDFIDYWMEDEVRRIEVMTDFEQYPKHLTVSEGEVDTAEEDEDVDATEYNGYEVFEGSMRVVAFTDEVFLAGASREAVETAIDASEGDERLLFDEDDQFQTMDSRIQHRDMVAINLYEEVGFWVEADGYGVEVGEEMTEIEAFFQMSDEESAVEFEEDAFAGEFRPFAIIADVELNIDESSIDDTLVTMETTIPTEKLWE